MSERIVDYRKKFWPNAPLFHQPWWLDAVCGNNWDVAVINEGERIKAYYLFVFKKDAWGCHVTMPPLTQFLGPNYQLTSKAVRQRNNEESELLEQLLQQLPACSSFESRWHYSFQNWLPFHWQNFLQRTRYTYVIGDLSNPEALRENFSEKVNREINKAEKNFQVEKSSDVKEFYSLLEKNFNGKHVKMPFEISLLQKIYDSCIEHNSGQILQAKDHAGKTAAGIFVAWDSATLYYIIGGKDDAFGNSGAMSFLFWYAFNEFKASGKSFDFEGSMIKGVENYFRSFGATQKGFFEITKINSPILKMKSTVKSILRR